MADEWYILVPAVVGYTLTACPSCGARNGERCLNRTWSTERARELGKYTTHPHQARARLIETWSAQQLRFIAAAMVLFRRKEREAADELLTMAMMWDDIEAPEVRCEAILAAAGGL